MPDGERDEESESERLNRNFDDLLQELRVSQNGTQILFAFLLTVPFSSGFKSATPFERGFYFAALLLAALSAAMLIAPAVMHRLLFRQQLKRELVMTAGRVAFGGQVLLVFAVSAAVFLVGDYLYGHVTSAVLAFAVLLWTSTWFFVVPWRLRRRSDQDGAADSTSSM